MSPEILLNMRASSRLTDRLQQPVDTLAVGVRLVPDERVGQVWLSRKPLLEEAAHHSHHQMDLDQRDEVIVSSGSRDMLSGEGLISPSSG